MRKQQRQLLCSWLALLAIVAFVGPLLQAAEWPPQDVEFFERRIRPLFVQHCFECHHDNEAMGSLRLDSRTAMLRGGDLGPAIDLKKPAESLLLRAIGYDDEDLQMPPSGKLSAREIAAVREWIERGAPWSREAGPTEIAADHGADAAARFTPEMRSHWSFQPRKASPPPAAADGSRNIHPIDAFLDAKLIAQGLATAPPADPRTLIRRLSFNLTGLPPAPKRVQEFVSAHSASPAAATAALVDELLETPQYAEHWARHWLDVARYADSNGSEVDHAMANAWRYRDYVVGAFERDLPYDRFVREQVAGDLVAPGDASALVATGFLMLGPKALAELDKPKLAADVIDEQVDTVSRAFLGLTMGCARCHDHKFDPLATADYYALAGIFQSTRSIDSSERVSKWIERPRDAEVAREHERLGKALVTLRQARTAAAKELEQERPALAADAAYLVVEAETFLRGNVRVDTDELGRGIGVVRTRKTYPDHIEYEFDLAAAGDYQLELRYASNESRPTQILINGQVVEMDAAAEITGDFKPSAQKWFVQGRYAFRQGRNILAFHRDGPAPLFDKWIIGRPSDRPHSANRPLAVAAVSTVAKQRLADLDAQIAAADDALDRLPFVLAPIDGPGIDVPILIRGNPATPGRVTPRGFPQVIGSLGIPSPGDRSSGRLELANWLVRPEHPLTARVIVNRVWLWHFGEGLMRTPDNFGLRGEPPTHPELLDWLAEWFVKEGWSIRKLQRLICTSQAYQRSSGVRSPLDPENRWLASFPRRRLQAEELRDSMLAVAGQLDLTRGGSLMTVPNRTYANGGNAPPNVREQLHYESRRRSLYLPIIRTGLYEFFAVFDYPDPGMLTGRRASTVVAPQALFLLNNPFVQERASEFAARLVAAADGDDARIALAYALALSREPSPAEIEQARRFIAQERSVLNSPNAAPREPAAWRAFCHALLAANEFLYVR